MNDDWSGAIVIPLPAVQPPADAAVDPMRPLLIPDASTVGAGPTVLDPPCGAPGPDVFYAFTLDTRAMVYADTLDGGHGAWSTRLFFADSAHVPVVDIATGADGGATVAGTHACDAEGTGGACAGGAQAVAVLDAGDYFLVLASAGGATGSTTIRLQRVPIARNATVDRVPDAGLASITRSILSTGGPGAGQCRVGQASENDFWWPLCRGATLGPWRATACDMVFDPNFLLSAYLHDPSGESCAISMPCPGTTLGVVADVPGAMGPGLVVLHVGGLNYRSYGPYRLSVLPQP